MPITERVAAELPATIKTATYSLVTDDVGREIQFESSTAVTANLLPVAEAGNGYNVILRNLGSGNLTIDPSGSELIDGDGSVVLTTGEVRWIRSDATAWRTISTEGPNLVSGRVIQVVHDEFNGTTSVTGTTWTATGLDVAITPIGSSSKIMVQGVIMVAHENTAYVQSELRRDGNRVFPNPASPGNRTPTMTQYLASDRNIILAQPFMYVDSPATTSEVTYAVYFRSSAAATDAHINRGDDDSDTSGAGRGSSVIIAMEIEA